jgi:hypothetical protein
MTIEPTNIGSAAPAPAISGQMAHIVYALEGLRQDAKAPPLSQLKPGQLQKRIDKYLLGQGFDRRELPSRSTFDRFRRQFGLTFGIR